MLQIVNISNVRNNLANIVKQIRETKNPVVVIQDSTPVVVISAYEEDIKDNSDYISRLKNIKGNWFSLDNFKKNRQELNKRFSKSGYENPA